MNASDHDSCNSSSIISSSRKRDHRRQDVATVGDCVRAEETDQEEELFMEALLNPNFDELSRQFRYFQKVFCTKQKSLHQVSVSMLKKKHIPVAPYITTPEFTMALSRALLQIHFGLSLTVEDSDALIEQQGEESAQYSRFLCPPIPNRFFYVHWIVRKLLPMLPGRNNVSPYFVSRQLLSPENVNIYGLDIGTGATCIYPLLMSHYNRKRLFQQKEGPAIFMHATDIDPVAVQLARTNVAANHLQSLVRVHLVPKSSSQTALLNSEYDASTSSLVQGPYGPLILSLGQIQADHQEETSLDTMPLWDGSCDFQLDFVMTNPPFHDSNLNAEKVHGNDDDDQRMQHEVNHLHDSKSQSLRGRTTFMTVNEGYYPKGEVGFGLDLILDSWNLFISSRPVPHWITMMCGKKSSFLFLKHAISQLLGHSHMCTTEFGPGEYTRWFLAWTFHRPSARSPLALIDRAWNFDVSIGLSPSTLSTLNSESSAFLTACQEVTNRFIEYCRTLSNPSEAGFCVICEKIVNPSSDFGTRSKDHQSRPIIRLQMCERHDQLNFASSTAQNANMGDESLPDCLKSCISQINSTDRMLFLPSDCGHFVLDISLSIGKDTRSSIVKPGVIEVEDRKYAIHVEIDSYRHSTYGGKRVEKIRSQLEQEICRTSRRWRRYLERNPPLVKPNGNQPMDES